MINRLKSLSIKARITLFTLAIFTAGVWVLFFFIQHSLHQDIEQLVSEQQRTTTILVADDINEQLNARLTTLQDVANLIDDPLFTDNESLQKFLTHKPALEKLFNQGFFVTDAQGTAIASIPVAMRRNTLNYLDLAHIAATLKDGNPRISSPLIGKLTQSPMFHFVVPIYDNEKNIMGCLVGAINLAQPNFLDRITHNHYGQTGGYVLLDATTRTVITATEKACS